MESTNIFVKSFNEWYLTSEDLKGIKEFYFENAEIVLAYSGMFYEKESDLPLYVYFASCYSTYFLLTKNLRLKNCVLNK